MTIFDDGTAYELEVRVQERTAKLEKANQELRAEIIERKRTEEGLRESGENYRRLFETMQEAFFIADVITNEAGEPVDYRFIEANKALETQTGIPLEKLIGNTALGIYSELDSFWAQTYGRVALTGKPERFDHYSGVQIRYYEVSVYQIRPGRFAAFFLDINDRKQADQALRASEERYRSLYENSLDGILLTKPDGTILSANPQACYMFGMTEDEIIRAGRDCLLVKDEKLAAALEERELTGRMRAELTHRRKDGSTFVAEVTSHLFTKTDGSVKTSMIIRDITERKKAEEVLRQNEQRIRLKLETILSPAREIADLKLSEIVDAQAIQSLMDDFYKLSHIPVGIIDLKGNVLVGVGWQDICTRFHRVHPEACKHCIESDTKLSTGVAPGEFKPYKCKNNMWDIVTPIIAGGRHIGNIFLGQFFFEGELLDYELFRSQARLYGFNEEEYIAALEKVPRLSWKTVDTIMCFYMKLANMLSQLSYSNIKLAQSLVERDALLEALQESERRERARSDELAAVLDAVPVAVYIAHDPQALQITGNRLSYEWLRLPVGTNFSKSVPEGEKPEMFKLFKDGVGMHPADMPSQMSAAGIEINNCELDIISADGETRHVLGNARPLRDEQGNPRGSISAFIDITERKKAEEALRLSNIYNRSLIEASLDPLVTIGRDGKITDVNGATEQVTGYSRNDLIGTDFSDYFTKPEKARASYQQVFTDGKVWDYPLEIQHKDGHMTPVLYNASVYRDENGEVIGVFAAARDITESKKAQEALKKVHDNLEKLVEERTSELEKAYNSLKEIETGLAEAQKMAHIGNWDWNVVTGEMHWSDELYCIFGRNPQDLAPSSYNEFLNYIHPDDRDYVANTIRKGLNGKLRGIDYRIVLANGEERTIHAQAEVIFDKNNTPIRVKGITQDITEHKKAEEKIQTLANAVESSNDAIVTESLDGIITSWNKGAEQIYGYSSEEILGKNLSILEPDNIKGEIKQLIEKVKQGEKVQRYETSRLKKDGTIIIVSVTLSPVFNESGEFVAISAIARDITERIRAEEALAKIEDARKKEIHHRIKNNLQVISSLLDLQAEKLSCKKTVPIPEILEAFRESQNRVISMSLIHEELHKGEVTDTLNFSAYLQKLAENLFQTYSLKSKNICLLMDLEENAFFDMDIAVPLGIIVNELVSNSLKHAFTENQEGEILIRLCREEEKSETNSETHESLFNLTISDNGKGIPEGIELESLESLGLQLVIALVDQLDGEIDIKRGPGTEFRIAFKIAEDCRSMNYSTVQ